MALWSPNGFKKVRTAPEETADGLNVSGAWDIDVLEELPPPGAAAGAGGAATAGANGQPPPKWLKVRAFSPDGETIQEGFMLQEWLKAIPVDIDRAIFSRACLAAA